MALAFSGWWFVGVNGQRPMVSLARIAGGSNDMRVSDRTPRVGPSGAAVLFFQRLCLICAVALLVGCSTLAPKSAVEDVQSRAIPISSDNALGKIALTSIPSPELSGFRLMPLGSYSLDTRLALAARAQRTLDVQYYHIENDETGRLFLRALRDAAARGVRVRLLMDDFYTSGMDTLLLGLAAQPNVEIRLFNPFCCAREQGQATRFLVSLSGWSRLNHRMHNKLFVADGAMAIVGGRNVANEYYLRGASDNFIDLDAFTMGRVVADLAAVFDDFWHSDPVYPLGQVTQSGKSPEELRAYFDAATSPDTTPAPPPLSANDVLGYGPVREDLDAGRVGLIWGVARVLADEPDKVMGGQVLDSVTYSVLDEGRKAQDEVVISSPYLIPGKFGSQLFQELKERNVRVQILTNSLASTDEPLVYTGYSRHRKKMLQDGVDLYELSSSRVQMNRRHGMIFGSSTARLHAKLVVIDRKTLFVGSMNLDPRSAHINTEMGLVIESPQLARELRRVIDIDKLQSAYRVRLDAQGQCCEWLTFDEAGEREMVLTQTPDASFWLQFKTLLLAPFVPEELL
jgi:cardiolipin synthase C